MLNAMVKMVMLPFNCVKAVVNITVDTTAGMLYATSKTVGNVVKHVGNGLKGKKNPDEK